VGEFKRPHFGLHSLPFATLQAGLWSPLLNLKVLPLARGGFRRGYDSIF